MEKIKKIETTRVFKGKKFMGIIYKVYSFKWIEQLYAPTKGISDKELLNKNNSRIAVI